MLAAHRSIAAWLETVQDEESPDNVEHHAT